MAKRHEIMTGNEACTHAAIAAGMRFFAGYPITPATEIAELSSELLPQVGGTYMQMEDELASMAAVIGASCSGVKAMTATSGPGFSLMQENLGFGIVAEVPLVLVDAMRNGPCQGVATVPAQGDIFQARWGTHCDHPIIALAPDSVSEVYTETIRAFNLSEKYRTPVILLTDAMLAHMSERVQIPDASELTIINRKRPTCDPKDYKPFEDDGTGIPPMATFGDGYRWYCSGITHDETGFPVASKPQLIQDDITRLMGKIENNIADIESYEEYMTEDADILFIAIGLVARSVKDAIQQLRKMGIKAGLLRPITLWPFPEKRLAALSKTVQKVVTCEMNEGQLYFIARAFAGNTPVEKITQSNGKIISAETIVAAIKGV